MKEVTLAIDCGFGDVKICIDGKFHKEISAIAQVNSEDSIQDENFVECNGNKYYVFNPATKLPSSTQISISNFDELKVATPIFIKAIEKNNDIKVNRLCLGLSLVMLDRSLEYKEYVSKITGIKSENIFLLPQGLGSKIAYSRYNLDINDPSKINDVRSMNYLGIDIGFNTVDVFQVIDGKVSTNVVRGFERRGIYLVAQKLSDKIKQDTGRVIDIPTAKEIISTGVMNWRGNIYDYSEYINKISEEYFIDLFKFIESEYASSIDKMDNILLVGGGAALYQKLKQPLELNKFLDTNYGFNFVMSPKSPEFYNVLGYHAYAISK